MNCSLDLMETSAATRAVERDCKKSCEKNLQKVPILVFKLIFKFLKKKKLKIQILDSQPQQKIILLPSTLICCFYSYAIVCTWL